MILVDANVVINVLDPGQAWTAWSRGMLRALSARAEDLVVNPVIVAEVAGNAPDLPSLLVALESLDIDLIPLDENSAFAAGQAFRRYRRDARDGDGRRAILADFLIGAHAARWGASLLTRDARLYRRYFPDLPLITPETHPHG